MKQVRMTMKLRLWLTLSERKAMNEPDNWKQNADPSREQTKAFSRGSDDADLPNSRLNTRISQ